MNEDIKRKLRDKIEQKQAEERNKQVTLEIQMQQLKMQELYLQAVKEIQELKFLQKSMDLKAQQNVNAVNAAGMNWQQAFNDTFHKVQLAHKDISYMTEKNEAIHSDLFQLQDNLHELANDLEQYVNHSYEAIDDHIHQGISQFDDNAARRTEQFNAMADKREYNLNSIIDKHKLYLKDYDIGLNKFKHQIDMERKSYSSQLKDLWHDIQKDKEQHFNGVKNLGETYVNQMRQERQAFNEDATKSQYEFRRAAEEGVSKYKDIYQKLLLQESKLENKGLLQEIQNFKQKKEMEVSQLKHIDAEEARQQREQEREQREIERQWQREIEQQKRERREQYIRDSRRYKSGKMSESEWIRRYPDTVPYEG